MSAHTPGPWEFDPDGAVIIATKCGYQWPAPCVVAHVGSPDYVEAHGNGRLIAAAPNLRDALFRICDADSLREARHIADEALASLGGDE